MKERIKNWAKFMEQIGPDELVEIPDADVFWKNRSIFESQGLGVEVFQKLFPIIEQQMWSIFALWCLARSTPKGARILEIGSGRGGSLSAIGLANSTAELTNIDRFETYQEETHGGIGTNGFNYNTFKANVNNLGINPWTILKWSNEAVDDVPDGAYGMVFVDGDHSYEACLHDIKNYSPKLWKSGILCGHDYHCRFPGVIKAVKEAFGEEGYFVMENSSVWVRAEEWMEL